jgi:hypothetical protein
MASMSYQRISGSVGQARPKCDEQREVAGLMRPARRASSRAMGMEAEEVLP